MDVVFLSQLQFAATCMFHWIFVPLTLGLSIMTAWMETQYVRTGDETWLRMTKFWGKLFLINFALGVVTGITMEFQFGLNWAEYSRYVGDIFGAPLAMEATITFFLESVFIGVWIFGWNKVSKKTHALMIWLAAIGTNLSALFILLANGWMQNPVGFTIRNGRAEMTDFLAVVTNPYGLIKFTHTLSSGYALAAFVVLGISAWHLIKGNEVDFFKRSFRMASIWALVSTLIVAGSGDFHGKDIAKLQPSKFAAMESVWETQKGAGMSLLLIPNPFGEGNLVETATIPGMLSFLAHGNFTSEVKGLKEFPPEMRPPVLPTFLSFRTMVAIGTLMILVSLASVFLSRREGFENNKLFHMVVFACLPLPYIAQQVGWLVAELGRQPWIVWGVLKTSAGASQSVTAVQVALSLAGFVVLYGTLGVVDFYLLSKHAKKGPDNDLTNIIDIQGRVQ